MTTVDRGFWAKIMVDRWQHSEICSDSENNSAFRAGWFQFCICRGSSGKMIELFKQLTIYMATGIEAAAGIIIGFAAIEASVKAFHLFIHRREMQTTKEEIRLHLGRWLALAIEFELAADILRTAMTPTWNEIGQLAAIIVIRTALNFFLQKEIDKAEQRRTIAST